MLLKLSPPSLLTIEAQVRLEDAVLVLRVDDEVGEVERPPDHVLAAVAHLPGQPAVLGSIERVARRHASTNA